MKLSNKIDVHPLTLCLLLIGFITGYIKYLLFIFMIVLLHEIGHIIFSKIFKRKIISLSILPFGGLIKMDCHISEDIFEDLLIAVGGIFMQTIFGFLLLFLKANGFITIKTFEFLNFYNTIIILFNLLPICPLDGYKIFSYIVEIFLPFKKSLFIAISTSIMALLIITIHRFDLFTDNILIFTFLIFIAIEEVRSHKYLMNRFYLERATYDFHYPVKKITKKEDMYKNKTNYINGIHEKDYLREFFT